MADLTNYNVADYQNPEEAAQLGTNQGQVAQNVLENTNKNYRSGADYIKGLWSSPDKSNRFQAISNVLGNVVGAAGNALKGEGSKGTQWNDFVNRYNDTMQRAGEQAAQDTSANVNTANVNALNRDQAEQQLAQARDIGRNTNAATEANIVRGQNLLGGASARDRILTDVAAAVTNTLAGNNAKNNANTDANTNTESTKAQDFQNDLNDSYESTPAKFADWVNDEAKLQSMIGTWTNEDIKNLPGLSTETRRYGPTIKNLVSQINFDKGFGSQSEDIKNAFYTKKEKAALKKAAKGGKLTPEVQKANENAKVRYANFLEMLER